MANYFAPAVDLHGIVPPSFLIFVVQVVGRLESAPHAPTCPALPDVIDQEFPEVSSALGRKFVLREG